MSVKEVVEMFIEQKILLYDGQGKFILDFKYVPERFKANKTDKTIETKDNFETLLTKYVDLFPKGVKSGGRLVRKTPHSLRAKLQAFVNRRKDIPYEHILEGTRVYIAGFKAKGYEYMQCADYFISKNGSSELESYAELSMEGDLKSPSSDNFVDSLN